MQPQSTPAPDRLAGARAKLERAKQHIRNLEAEIRAFFATNPYVVRAKRDPETRKPVHCMESVADVPIVVSLLAGDALQNLRSALDHLAYQLVSVGMATDGPFPWAQFPIADSAKEYEAKKGRQIKGMRKDAVEAIDAVKPYQGGMTSCGGSID